jgi:hypothetical protein
MLTKNKLAIITVLLTVGSSVMAAQARTAVDLNGGIIDRGGSVTSSATAAQARTAVDSNGSIIDGGGWRLWNGNWDNTCFRTLKYLPAMSACSGAGS